MQMTTYRSLAPIALSAPALAELGSVNGTEHQLMKRDAQILWGSYYGPQPSEIKGSKLNNDWFLCAAASISHINPYAIKKHFKATSPSAQRKRKEKDSEKFESIELELFNIEENAFQITSVKYDEISDKNSISGDAWWAGAYEIGAPRVGGNEYIIKEGFKKDSKDSKGGFKKDGKADIGLRTITGLEGVTSDAPKLEEDLWSILIKGKKSPICVEKDHQWFGFTGIEGGSKDDNVNVTLYDTRKGEYTRVELKDLAKDISHYSKLKNDDKL
ncbi:hypothetical protein I302_106825 [Kwoniella bestiolae CBS 10118]|uniref:Uncharacterized protein n=1 Tax=Kwoniella bestiolae CBS 10118 TaxID=1296100 RepID=A0A1B9G0B1_9TREE|nr:hypothetical protein I302_05910 [Kwoniella bestiolae CBS 10118]OCF24450.1 hypothetical protein I302_05910 [Kwoniella bestiolae CBS 10118]